MVIGGKRKMLLKHFAGIVQLNSNVILIFKKKSFLALCLMSQVYHCNFPSHVNDSKLEYCWNRKDYTSIVLQFCAIDPSAHIIIIDYILQNFTPGTYLFICSFLNLNFPFCKNEAI